MPTYQYACRACGGEHSEFRMSTAASDPGACPSCGGETRKVFRPSDVNLMVTQRFRRHVTTTGLKMELGNGPGLDVNFPKHRGTLVKSDGKG